jgi:hypothetical protein
LDFAARVSAEELIVFGVRADPKPDESIGRFDSKGAMMLSDPR